MVELNEDQFRVLCDLYLGHHWFLPEEVGTMDDAGLVVPEDVPDDNFWDLTDEGEEHVESRGRELAKPGFGDLTATEKKVILWTKLFPEGDRRRLLFDRDVTVVSAALGSFDLTEEEFTQLGGHPSPEARSDALRSGMDHLRGGEDLDRKLWRYLRHTDEETVEAILEALHATMNTDFVGEGLITRWLRSSIPHDDLLRMLCGNGVEVPDDIIASLVAEQDPLVLEIASRRLLHRLDPGQVDTVIADGTTEARVEVARFGTNLTASQVERLANDDSAGVRLALLRRLGSLSRDLKMVEDDPELMGRIRNGSFPEPAAG